MRSALFCAITQLIMVIHYQSFGKKTIGPNFKGQEIQEVVIPCRRFGTHYRSHV